MLPTRRLQKKDIALTVAFYVLKPYNLVGRSKVSKKTPSIFTVQESIARMWMGYIGTVQEIKNIG
jgi:hypothetical protein